MIKQKKEYLPDKVEGKFRISQEIPVPVNSVLYIDLDGTLIDGSYQIIDTEIFASIQKLQAQGWQIGLSSDTPLGPLRTWKKEFGMNGDIIAERGCIVEIDSVVYDLRSDLELFQLSLETMRKRFLEQGFLVWTGDAVEFIRQKKTLGNPGDTVIIINKHRTQSLAFYTRKVNEFGELTIDSRLTHQAVDSVKDVFPDIDDLSIDLNDEYGILILSRASVVKRVGTLKSMSQQGFQQIGMIGNSITDFVGSDIAIHYAVSNSTQEFQDVADYISMEPVTIGVSDILQKLAESRTQ